MAPTPSAGSPERPPRSTGQPAGRSAEHWIQVLSLAPHPEGGHFRETYRSVESIPGASLPSRFDGDRPLWTAIYFLLRGAERSLLHRLRSDEVWHFYEGSALELTVIHPGGRLTETVLGRAVERGQSLQALVPAGSWCGAVVSVPDSYALVGCTVAPGFEFGDFELADRATLLARYPGHRATIERLTR